jgi:HupE / UreJ protein
LIENRRAQRSDSRRSLSGVWGAEPPIAIENRRAQRSDSRRSLSGAWGAEPPIAIARWLAALAVLAALLFSPTLAWAHKPSDSYLTLHVAGAHVGARWDIALRDLDNAIGLDSDHDGAITWKELRARRGEISDYALDHLALRGNGAACKGSVTGFRVVDHSDGAYAVLDIDEACPTEPSTLDVDYELFFELDPLHDGIVRIDQGGTTKTAIFTTKTRKQSFDGVTTSRLHQLGAAISLGISHIFSGIDHLLFLIALLLPAVVVREGKSWRPVEKLKPALVDVLKIVTAFTLAHSITLSLSALDVLRLPSRLVESGIAASVIVAAINNVWPVLAEDRWTAAFALGLLHGFGFSATLMDLGLPRENLVVTLFGFNVGVEIGQMCIVALFVPLAYLARRTRFYRLAALTGGSLAIAAVATVWLVQRVTSR